MAIVETFGGTVENVKTSRGRAKLTLKIITTKNKEKCYFHRLYGHDPLDCFSLDIHDVNNCAIVG